MNILLNFSDINWLSVLVATIVAFGIGGLWYSPVLFGNIWAKEIGLTPEKQKEANMGLIFGTTFVLNFLGATVLELFLGKSATYLTGIVAGLIIAIAWIATAIGTLYLFERKSFRHFCINAGYFLVYYPIMGFILGVWQ